MCLHGVQRCVPTTARGLNLIEPPILFTSATLVSLLPKHIGRRIQKESRNRALSENGSSSKTGIAYLTEAQLAPFNPAPIL